MAQLKSWLEKTFALGLGVHIGKKEKTKGVSHSNSYGPDSQIFPEK